MHRSSANLQDESAGLSGARSGLSILRSLSARASLLTALLVLSLFTWRLARNLRFLQRTRSLKVLSGRPPRVSILVPARDEALNIVACVESLARQQYPDVELIVLDDCSSDETPALLDDLAKRFPHLTVLHGADHPPAGWNGKSFACHRLAERATGEWLLFTDADTLHEPGSIAAGVAQALALNVDLLSALPAQVTGSWSERLVVSFILDFLTLLSVDLTSLWRGDTTVTAANGQYLLIRAAAYREIGGHQAVFQALLDDFALARRARASGFRVVLVDGTTMVSCRMYRNAREVWLGFTRSILLALETSSRETRRPVWAALFAWAYASVFITPFYRVLFASKKGPSLFLLAWLTVLRAVVNRSLMRPLGEVVTTPLAGWSVMAFGLGALSRRRLGGRVRWKGRDYAEAD